MEVRESIDRQSKQVYVKPSIEELGNVDELTRGVPTKDLSLIDTDTTDLPTGS